MRSLSFPWWRFPLLLILVVVSCLLSIASSFSLVPTANRKPFVRCESQGLARTARQAWREDLTGNSGNDATPKRTWGDNYAILCNFHKEHGHVRVPKNYPKDPELPAWLEKQRKLQKKMSQERFVKLDALQFWARSWEESYNLLVAFNKQNGHSNVRRHYKKDPKLGGFANNQRARYKKGTLSADKIARLEAINFRWDAGQRSWDQNYNLLVEFYKEHGHANVPKRYKKDPKLGDFVEFQRKQKGSLSDDKVAKLDALDFIWDGRVVRQQSKEQRWEDMFQCLLEYKNMTGDCLVPFRYGPNPKLGNWVYTQRRFYTLQKLSQEGIEQLEAIGFAWRLKEFQELESDTWEQQWDNFFQELICYKETNGDCNVPQSYNENECLAQWVKRQRQLNAEERLRQDRKERLDEIGFVWDFKEEVWDAIWLENFNELEKARESIVSSRGTIWNFPGRSWSNYYQADLRSWEQNQQHAYERGTIDPEREAILDRIGYWKSLGLIKGTNT